MRATLVVAGILIARGRAFCRAPRDAIRRSTAKNP
jgi:hypothetical protein